MSEQEDKLYQLPKLDSKYRELKPESNFDKDNLTPSQVEELKRRAAMDYAEYGSNAEYRTYIDDVANRKHLSWY